MLFHLVFLTLTSYIILIGVKQKEIMLECNKKYTVLALNSALKNSKEMILLSEIKKRDKNNNIKRIYEEHLFMNTFIC